MKTKILKFKSVKKMSMEPTKINHVRNIKYFYSVN